MDLEMLTEALRRGVGEVCHVEKKIMVKLTTGEGVIFVDGTVNPCVIDNIEREECDIRFTVTMENFYKLMTRELSGKKLAMTGRLGIKGDIRLAMKTDDIFFKAMEVPLQPET